MADSRRTFGHLLGELIYQKRKARGYTQLQLAEDAYGDGKKVRRIHELENGQVANPHLKTIDPIIVELGISEQELLECTRTSNSNPNLELDQAYREATNLIEEIAQQFELSNPDATLEELNEFLSSKAKEWLELRSRISDLESVDSAIDEFYLTANQALAKGEFEHADDLLMQAEDYQQASRTMEEVTKQAHIRVTRGDLFLLKGDNDRALELYKNSAALFQPLDEGQMVDLLNNLAGRVYEAGRRSLEPNYVVAIELLNTALETQYVRDHPRTSARINYSLALVYRNSGIVEHGTQRIDHIENSIRRSRIAIKDFEKINKLDKEETFEFHSTKINLANSLVSKAEFQKDPGTMRSAIEIFKSLREELYGTEASRELLPHIHNNLGNALLSLNDIEATVPCEQSFDEVLDCFQRAVRTSEQIYDIVSWGHAQLNVGRVLSQKILLPSIDEDKARFIRLQSIAAYQTAIETQPSDLFPRVHAEALLGIAQMLVEQGIRSHGALSEAYFARALGAFEGASIVYFSEERSPSRWAEIQMQSGRVFFIHAQFEGIESKEYDLKMAREHFDNAKRVFLELGKTDMANFCDQGLGQISDLIKNDK